jgi:hypothetical protein
MSSATRNHENQGIVHQPELQMQQQFQIITVATIGDFGGYKACPNRN